MTGCLARPSRRLGQDNLKKYREIFNEWRQKTSRPPLNDLKLGQHNIYDED
jgi:hypothetical protein